MASTYQLLFDGTPADDDLYTLMTSLEVEENADLPDAIRLSLPINTTKDGDLRFVSDDRFKPFANLAVVATAGDAGPQCIFDGYVLAHKIHLQTGTTASTIEVWGQDSSWLMNLEEKVQEWTSTNGAVANAIFADYGVSPAADNTTDDSPAHTEDGHTLMQRATDIQFLRGLARRAGKLCRVACTDTAGQRTGYFVTPKVDGDAAVTLTLNDPEGWTVNALDIEWDVMRPTAVTARQASLTDSDADGVTADAADSGLALLDARGLADFSGKTMTVLLTTPTDAGELTQRAQALLREADWFVRCTGEADVARLKSILRVGMIVALEGVGAVHSGKYFVWSVRHTLTTESHRMKFVLVRNAVGNPPAGGGTLGGLL
jgi:hypothetical protein